MKRSHLLLLGLILLVGFFFRTYKIVDRFEFAHDGDLYSWIVKDIVVNHHLRLIGQLTSAPGIFIGPFFYYLLVPFFIIFKMDPIGALVPATLIGLATILSFYFVFSKFFGKETGLIGAFLYAVLLTTVGMDRWVVPTITTSLWAVWYLYTILMMAEGNFSVLLLLGILIGLIWNVHIALLPALLAVPVAIVVSGKKPSLKQALNFTAALLITSLPLILFETRHHFSQTFALVNNFLTPQPGPKGLYKLKLVLTMVSKNLNSLFFSPQSFPGIFWLIPAITASTFILIKQKLINLKKLWPLIAWFLGVILFFSASSSPISEYYFANLDIVFLLIVSLLLYQLFKTLGFGKITLFLLFAILLAKNAYFMVTQNYYNKGYVEKKAVVEYIARDAATKRYPCVGITYITAPGENVGFRYFFYLQKMHLVHPSFDIPVYNIVIPDELSKNEVKQKFGHIGVIPPNYIPSEATIEKSCRTPDTNLTDPVLGYVQ